MEYVSTFGVLDYIVFALMLIISLAIGIFASMKGNKSPEDFLMGSRAFGPIPIAMSLLTSIVSAISLLGFSGEAYAYGIQLYLFVIGIVIGIYFSAVTTVPVLYPLRLTSVNEYIELRFNSPGLRKVILLITTVKGVLYMGVCLYAPTIALSAVTPLTSMQYIFILGGVVTIYSSIGGIRAVVWTDVFQLTVMFTGLVVIVVASLLEIGSFTRAWDVAVEGGRMDVLNTNPSLYERHNIYNTVAFGFFLFSSLYGVSQINVQRLCSVRSLKDSYVILVLNAVGMVIIYTLIFGTGVLGYVIYQGCDPLELGIIKKKEEIIPYLVVDRLRYITGLPGIFVATVIGGALSSLSSVMNAQVAMIWEDLCIQMTVFQKVKPITASIINKIMSFIIGVIIMGTAVIASYSKSLIQFSLSLTGIAYGAVYGAFLLGLLFPRTNLKGVWSGMVFSIILIMFVSTGSFIYGKAPAPLQFSIDKCEDVSFNTSDIIVTKTHEYNNRENATMTEPELSQTENILMYFFGISYTLYVTVGTSVCILVGIIVSYFTGNEDIKAVSPKYISPFLRSYYWTKEELELYEKNDQKTEMIKL